MAEIPVAQTPYLVCRGIRYGLDGPRFVGRRAWCDLRFDDGSLSRIHAVFIPTPNETFVVDLGSRNGVTVGGERVSVQRLKDGDRVGLAAIEAVYHEPAPDPTLADSADTLTDGFSRRAILAAAGEGPAVDELLDRVINEDALEAIRARRPSASSPAGRLLILYQAARLVSESLDPDEVLSRMVDLAMDVLAADRGLVALTNPDDGLEVRVWRTGNENEGEPLLAFSRSLARRAMEAGQPVLAADPNKERRADRSASMALLSISSAMAAPLVHGGRTLGVLYVDKRLSGRSFDAAELQMLEAMARQSAVALANSELYDSQRRSLERIEKQQAALVQSEKLAAMGLLSAGVGHEIRNPLTIALGNLSLLASRQPDDDCRRMVEQAAAAVERICAISDGLMGMAGSWERRARPFDPATAIRQGVSSATWSLDEAGSPTVETAIPEGLPPVRGVKRELSQVIINLVSNAIAVAGAGGTVRVTARVEGASLLVEVADSGPGVDPSIVDSLFQPFVSRRESGTGLGLWISRRIVEEMGGDLRYERRGAETVFIVRVPVARTVPA